MELQYKLSIPEPHTHIAHITINAKRESSDKYLDFFIPSWSPGSYLMREYGRNIRVFLAFSKLGERLVTTQIDKGIYRIDFANSELKSHAELEFSVKYEIFCHELTVRTSHIDQSHAFIHGPSTFMGVLGKEMLSPQLEIEINPLWSKITTGLTDISNKREVFLYSAKDYDEFIDCPIEIGCHETDGFMADGKPHELAFYGQYLNNGISETKVKEDIKKVVEHILKTMGGAPYDRYVFMTHLAPSLFGGLEHLNSTALQYCSYEFSQEKGYKGWLELVAHEFFHLWNVKRIRPIELGPFDYTNEALTRMHWLTEGLTSFMDQYFIFRTDFYSLQDYLDCFKTSINRYQQTPGRKYHSAEDSSFNSWIKLYRPDENSNNSSVSYYLKGGLIFMVLHFRLLSKGKGVLDLVDALWKRYQENPKVGLVEEEVFEMIRAIAGEKIRDEFVFLVKGVDEIDFETLFNGLGIDFEYEDAKADLGINVEFKGDRVVVKSVRADSSAYRCGLNAGDEILSVNGLRFLKSDYDNRDKIFLENKRYTLLVSRLGNIITQEILVEKGLRSVKSIKVRDGIDTKELSAKLKGSMPN